MPTTLAPQLVAAWIAIVPHPQPTSKRRLSWRVVQAELARDQLVLGLLSLLEAHGRVREAGTRIGHRLTEDELVELVAHVVVVRDRPNVPPSRMTQSPEARLFGRGGQGAPYGPGSVGGTQGRRRGVQPDPQVPRSNSMKTREHRDEIAFELDVAGDIGTSETELAGRPQDAAQRIDRTNMNRSRSVGRPEPAAVPQLESDRQLPPDQAPHQGCQGACRLLPRCEGGPTDRSGGGFDSSRAPARGIED